MVTQLFENATLELSKSIYTIKTKISGYIADDTIDRSKMKILVLKKSNITFYVDITTAMNGNKVFRVELDTNSSMKEGDVNLEKLYNAINDVLIETTAVQFLLDSEYNVFCFSYGKNEYIPYKLEKLETIELSILGVNELVDKINKDKDFYFIMAFPDRLYTVDYYTTHNLIYLLIKIYVETRFPVRDNEKYKEKRIISLQGFTFIFYHLKSLLKAKNVYKDTIKAGFETMSKLNLLPYVPYTNWYVEENVPNLETKRLKDFISHKQTMFEKIMGKKHENTVVNNKKDDIFIPEYYTHIFDNKCKVMLWHDFVNIIIGWEQSFLEFNNYEFIYVTPTLIVPDNTIPDLNSEDILFLGFDGEKLCLVINSKVNSDKETVEETALRDKLTKYFLSRFGVDVEITFDMEKLIKNNIITLDAGG